MRLSAPEPTARWSRLLPMLAIIFAGLVAYHNSFEGVLLLDDIATIERNPSIRTLSPAKMLAPPPGVGTAGRPFANATFAINFALGGTSVRGYHGVNLFIHIATALLIPRVRHES